VYSNLNFKWRSEFEEELAAYFVNYRKTYFEMISDNSESERCSDTERINNFFRGVR